jgi:CheY-like chemotaxis protein
MMANVLLLDDSAVAGRAMQGILTRGGHRCAVARSGAEAWTLLREAVKFDLLITEVRMASGSGLDFMQRLRGDCFFRPLPVVIYANACEQAQVRRAVALKTQNYLLKPYNEQLIYAEVAKAVAQSWRSVPFEDERTLCAQMNISPEDLRGLRLDLMNALDGHARFFTGCAEGAGRDEALPRIVALLETAQAAGFWGLVENLSALQAAAEADNWTVFLACREHLEFASRLIFCQLNSGFVPDALRSDEERQAQAEMRERERWAKADVKNGQRPVTAAELQAQVDALPGCPVIDSVAASFQMMADTRATALSQLMDVVSRDPGLSAQVLAAANRLDRDGGPVEDARAAASMLGGLKLQSIAMTLPTVAERHFRVPPITWPQFWIFQLGVARMTQYVCNELELGQLASAAYNAGLLHDLGRLILLKLHPAAWGVMLAYARQEAVALSEAEKAYLGCTTRDLGARFVTRQGLPPA